MASRLIVIRQRLTAGLHAAFAAFTGEVSPALDERVGPFLADEDASWRTPTPILSPKGCGRHLPPEGKKPARRRRSVSPAASSC